MNKTEVPQARIDAALRLADIDCEMSAACDAKEGVPPPIYERLFAARCDALSAYRATLPKLRSRAEIDAELVSWIRGSVKSRRHINPTWTMVLRLCAEPTAPEENE